MLDKFFIGDTITIDWDYVNTLPEFQRLRECEQNPVWHSEGSAWEHTVACVNVAYSLLKEMPLVSISKRKYLAAVLFHDIGKGTTTTFSKNAWHAYGHEFEGEKITRRILWDEDIFTREAICQAIRYHMEVLNVFKHKNTIGAIMKLTTVSDFDMLMFLKKCDIMGSCPSNPKVTEESLNTLDRVKEVVRECLGGGSERSIFKRTNSPMKRLLFNDGKITLEKPKVVTMMIGLPGAGKDTYIAKNFPNAVNISRDIARIELGFCKENEKKALAYDKEAKVTEQVTNTLLKAMKENREIVINDTNLRRKNRDAYKQMFKDYNIFWKYIYIQSPNLATNIKRREGQIEPEVFTTLINNFDFPQLDEFDTIEYELQRKEA